MSGARVSRRRSAYATMVGSAGSSAVAAAQALVLLPLYLHEVGAHLYGAWLATGEVLVWLLAFDFGIPNLLIQRAGALLARGERRAIGAHFATSLLALSSVGVLLYAVVWFSAPFVGRFVGSESADLVVALRVSGLATSLMLVAYGFVGLARGLQETALVQGFSLIGTAIGFGLTATLLLSHHGLQSIAFGLLARSGCTLLGGLVFLLSRGRLDIVRSMRPTGEAWRDILKNCPPMFAAGIGYALMNNSMLTISAVMFGPVATTVLGITRKAADLARMVLDMIGHSSYGGFAHLWSEGSRERSGAVYRELQATFFLVATGLFAAYVAVNPVFIANWVGAANYGGFALTLALALSTVCASWSYLQIGTYRSMGHHSVASSALLIECGARLVLMVLLAWALGVVGLALGAIVTAVTSGVWCSGRIRRELGDGSGLRTRREWTWRALPLVAASAVGFVGFGGGWSVVIGVGAAFCCGAVALLVATDPSLRGIKNRFVRGAA